MATPDAYELLGIEDGGPHIDANVIKKAYRLKAIQLHPDKRPATEREAAEAQFHAMQQAYELLCDPSARKALDELKAVQRARKEARASGSEKRRKLVQGELS